MLKAALGIVIGVLIVVLFLVLRPSEPAPQAPPQVIIQEEIPWWRRWPHPRYGYGGNYGYISSAPYRGGWGGHGWGGHGGAPMHSPPTPHAYAGERTATIYAGTPSGVVSGGGGAHHGRH